MVFVTHFVSVLFIAGVSLAQPTDDRTLLKPYPESPLLNEVIAFEAVDGHKFNLESKNNCGNGRLIKESKEVIECQMFAPGTSELQLFICDQNNTFCRREIFKLTTQQPQGVKGWLKYYRDTLLSKKAWSTPYESGVSQNPLARGFVANDLTAAAARAKKEKKKLFMYFSQAACSPCRMLKELTFASDDFQALAKDYVLLQMDLDLDVEPAKTKALDIKGTPTIIIFDKDYKELARTTVVMSPAALKSWLEKPTSKPSWLISAESKTDAKERLAVLKAVNTSAFTFNNDEWYEYAGGLMVTALEAKNTSDPLFADSVALVGALEPKIKAAAIDELQRSFTLNSYCAMLQYVYENKERAKDAKVMRERRLAVLESFPKLPGVTETNQLALLRAEVSENPALKKQVYEDQRAQNKDDYSFDFWEASDAFEKKNYAAALTAVDKSLARAKDRSWQKAFLLKMDILKELKREAEAVRLIEDLLTQMKLPSDSAMKVHPFVQALRKKQFAYKAPGKV